MTPNETMKCAQDVTFEEWVGLAEAAQDLLGCARMVFWISGSGKDSDDDSSMRDSLDAAAVALEAVGLPQGTIEQFEDSLESLLRSELSPEQWRDRLGKPQ